MGTITFIDMAMITAVAVLLVLSLSLCLRGIALVIRHRGERCADEHDPRRIRLEIEKERTFENLRDLEFDYALRKVSDEDYNSLRDESEKKAVTVLREIDALEDEGIGFSWLIAASLASLLCLGGATELRAQTLPANHPNIGAPTRITASSPTRDVTAVVLQVTSDGNLVPLPYAPLVLEVRRRLPGPSGDAEVVETRTLTTGERGTGKIPGWDLPADATVRGYVPFGDAVFVKDWVLDKRRSEEAFVEIVVYDTTKDLSDLSMELTVHLYQAEWRDKEQNLMVTEGQLSASVDVVFVNEGAEAVDLRSLSQPFFVPLVAPVVGGQVVTRGWMPEQSGRHVSLDAPDEHGRLILEKGGLVYRGLVLPGRQTRVRYGYPLDIVASDMELGLVSENQPIEKLTVVVQTRSVIGAGLRLSKPSHLRDQREANGQSLAIHEVEGSLKMGQPIFLTVTRLPVVGQYTRHASFWLVMLIFLVFAVAMLRARALRPDGETGLLEFAMGSAVAVPKFLWSSRQFLQFLPYNIVMFFPRTVRGIWQRNTDKGKKGV